MKFAMLDGNRIEATKGAVGTCQVCTSPLVAKCGEVRLHHWAHKTKINCDHWWENETEWHRNWKGKFPTEWQEIIHFAHNGDKHIADVKTNLNWVLEFQHSHIDPVERRARNDFYKKLCWVVDGMRRKNDKAKFDKAIADSEMVLPKFEVSKLRRPRDCRIITEWQDETSLVFLDFQDPNSNMNNRDLWLLFPKFPNGEVYVAPMPRTDFVELHKNGQFDHLRERIIQIIRWLLGERVQTVPIQVPLNLVQLLFPNRRQVQPRNLDRRTVNRYPPGRIRF